MIASTENIKPGTEWMPVVPEHWQVIRIKNLFNEIDKRSVTGKEDLLSVSQYTGVTLRKDAFEDGKEITNAKTLKGYKLVEQGDLVVNIMLAWNGCLGISSYNGITSPAYCVYRVKNEQELNPEYFGYLFSTSLYKGEFRKRSTGIIESRLRLYSDAFFRIFCFVPPKKEQDKIVNLINSETAKITRFIQSKQRFIELLKEQRQSIITNAVTKGIDDGVKMKETGIDWMPEVPEHWEIRKIRRIFNGMSSGTTPESGNMRYYENGQTNWINTGDLNDGILNDCKYKVTKKALDVYPTLKVYPIGTILVAMYGATIGKVSLMEIEGCTNQACCALYDSDMYSKEFSLFAFLAAKEALIRESYGGGQPNISQDVIKRFKLPVPPIEEQKRIVEHIKTETRTLDIAISKAEREIELIKEYREAMIAEAVTGKIVVNDLKNKLWS